MMNSQKVVTPVKAGVQSLRKWLNKLDSGFRRNDEKGRFSTFYEIINIYSCTFLDSHHARAWPSSQRRK
jgi:hypothetical protein